MWIVAFLWLLVLIILFSQKKKKKWNLDAWRKEEKKRQKKEDIWSVDSISPSPCACYVGPTDESVSNFGPFDLEDGSWQISWGRFSRFNIPSSHFFMGEVEFGFSLNSGFSTYLFPWWFWLSNVDDQRVKSKKSFLFFYHDIDCEMCPKVFGLFAFEEGEVQQSFFACQKWSSRGCVHNCMLIWIEFNGLSYKQNRCLSLQKIKSIKKLVTKGIAIMVLSQYWKHVNQVWNGIRIDISELKYLGWNMAGSWNHFQPFILNNS